ncbi:MAG: ABC transporter ATP-binding protein [Lachnospiraceae bacterium]|nr:ABC transporter ATP-binding protein [Lachnospiraceae bacterium]
MIEVKNLTKKYGSHTVVKHLNFTIDEGKIYGFLGPNGAGKSTTMNMITGCLPMTEGEVVIDGHDIFSDPVEAKKCIGYLPEIPPLYPELTPEEYLTFVAEAKGCADPAGAVADAMEKTDITGMKDRLIKNLSKGYKQRVGIAQALLGNPKLIILDEPTVGLDPRQIIEIRGLIRMLGEKHTVILSSHILAEISAVCDHVMIISHGRMVASDTLDNIEKAYNSENVLRVRARGEAKRISAMLRAEKDVADFELDEMRDGTCNIAIHAAPGVTLNETIFRLFADAKCPILTMTDSGLSLEEIFVKLTSDNDAGDDEDEEVGEEGEEEEEEDEAPAPVSAPAPKKPAAPTEESASEALKNEYHFLFSRKDEDEDEDEEEDVTGEEKDDGDDDDDDDDYKPLFSGKGR